ncbi:MAG: hypothetical protein ACREXT_14275, partial [Gammaproteobacteria bacterium]
MIKWIGTIVMVLLSSNAIANDPAGAAIRTYIACLDQSYAGKVEMAAESIDAAIDATFASCAPERSQAAAILTSAYAGSTLAKVDA